MFLRFTIIVGLCILLIMAVVWLIVCAVSPNARKQRFHLAKQFAIIGVLITSIVSQFGLRLVFQWWPPDWVERRTQRRILQERIQAAGGWEVIRRDCIQLSNQHDDGIFYWSRGHTNALPGGISKLKPMEVRFTSPKNLQQNKDYPKVPFVRIKLFGTHSTGGHSSPYLGLEVVCDTNALNYRPEAHHNVAPGNRYTTYRRIADGIFEVY